MGDEVEAPAASNSDSRPGLPPLRIHHILIATVAIAVLLSVNEGLRQKNEFAGLSQYLRSILGIVQTISTGLAVTAVLFGFWWRREGRAFFNQPGHWLLIDRALWVGMLVFAAVTAVLRLTADGESFAKIDRWVTALLMLSIAITLWAGFRVADTVLWKTLFLLTGAFWLAMFTLRWFGADELMMAAETAGASATTFVLLAAAVADCRARRERDWPHWLGVVLVLSTSAMWFVQSARNWIVG